MRLPYAQRQPKTPPPFTPCTVCVTVCETCWLLFRNQGYFRGGGPSSLHCCNGLFIAPLCIFINNSLFSPISVGCLWAASCSTNCKPPFVETNLPLSSLTPPSTMASFLLWRSGMKKKLMKWGWRRRTSTAASIGRALATASANRSTASEMPSERRPWRSRDWWRGWVEDKMMGGRGWRRTEEGIVVMDWSGAWLVWVREEDKKMEREGAASAHKQNKHVTEENISFWKMLSIKVHNPHA